MKMSFEGISVILIKPQKHNLRGNHFLAVYNWLCTGCHPFLSIYDGAGTLFNGPIDEEDQPLPRVHSKRDPIGYTVSESEILTT